jgi:hypothetical protein
MRTTQNTEAPHSLIDATRAAIKLGLVPKIPWSGDWTKSLTRAADTLDIATCSSTTETRSCERLQL